jgi:DNA-binding LytR/AlgR family response regulator
MLLIAVVDDDPRDSALLKWCVDEYYQKNNHAAVVHVFHDGLDFIRSAETHDVVFLDIQMGKLDGLETARFIRKINKESILIFVTNMAQFAIKGYEVDALDFIVKPASMASITYVLDKAMKRLGDSNNAFFSVKTSDGTVTINSNDIQYVEVFDHYLVYHTTKGELNVRGRISDVSEKLDQQRFVLCNRSFVVNLRYVSNMTADTLTVGDTQISISKSRRRELMQRFSSFLGDSL